MLDKRDRALAKKAIPRRSSAYMLTWFMAGACVADAIMGRYHAIPLKLAIGLGFPVVLWLCLFIGSVWRDRHPRKLWHDATLDEILETIPGDYHPVNKP